MAIHVVEEAFDSPLIFDTGPISHFVAAGWLGLLETMSADRGGYIPDTVHKELRERVDTHPHLRAALEASWLRVVPIVDLTELTALAKYTSRLAGGGRNYGECGVLAVAECRRWEAVVDDRVARKAGQDEGVTVSGTLSLLCRGIRTELLTVSLVSSLADQLLATEYRLPFEPGGFERWASESGLVE